MPDDRTLLRRQDIAFRKLLTLLPQCRGCGLRGNSGGIKRAKMVGFFLARLHMEIGGPDRGKEPKTAGAWRGRPPRIGGSSPLG
jgi:hypothetical protein